MSFLFYNWVREQLIQQRIRAVFNRPGAPTRVWRNNVGGAKVNGQFIRWGLAPGSADLIGIYTVMITPDMVGETIGQFFSAEIKTEKGLVREDQLIWQDTVRRFGGISEIFRSEEEAKAFLKAG